MMVKRIWNNLKWLFNRPPTIIAIQDEVPPCDYCGETEDARWWVVDRYCICEACRKKVFDKVLKGKENELSSNRTS